MAEDVLLHFLVEAVHWGKNRPKPKEKGSWLWGKTTRKTFRREGSGGTLGRFYGGKEG